MYPPCAAHSSPTCGTHLASHHQATIQRMHSSGHRASPSLPASALPAASPAVCSATLPGGARESSDFDHLPPSTSTPPAIRKNQLEGTAEGYRLQAIADGILPRPDGLFTSQDGLLNELASTPGLHAFEKHLPGSYSPYEQLHDGGWITGNESCKRGIDLRLFWQEPAGEQHGSLKGAVRFGCGAEIGANFFLSAHGGAIETVLDEATAELAKCEFAPFLSTVEASFKIKKPVPLHTTLLVVCSITQLRGIRCWVEGSIQTCDGTTLATCAAVCVNMVHFIS